MRGGLWCLTACGIVGLILSVGSADDLPFTDFGASSAEPDVGRSTLNAPSRFYSRRLRGETPDDVTLEAQRPGAAASTPNSRIGGNVEPPTRYTRNRDFPAGGGSAADVRPPGRQRERGYLDELFSGDRAASAAGSDSRKAEKPPERDPQVVYPTADDDRDSLRHAEYQRPAGAPESGRIRQARATDENVNPFAPDDADDEPKHEESDDAQIRFPERSRRPLPLPDPKAANAAEPSQKVTVSRPTARGAAASMTGPQTPMVTIHWVQQSDINIGQECHLQLHVTNSGKIVARDVAVEAYFPDNVRLTKAVPAPAETTDHLTWKFDELTPGQQQVIDIRMIPSRREELPTTAYVTFTAEAGSLFQVNEPLLAVTVDGPKEILVGDPASQIIKVTNPGTGVATNVKLEAIVPAGLEHLRGERLSMEIGSLNPGETRVVRLALGSVGGGEQVLNVQVAADGDLRKTEAKTINVVAPSLSATITGPDTRYVGRPAQYTLTVNNDSDVASNNVRAVYKLPKGFKLLRADHGGRLDAAGGAVGWFLGRLEPGKAASRTVYLTADQPGEFTHQVTVTSEHGTTASAELATSVDATASLALQIVERDDPVKVGVETAVEVRVQNDGTKPALNVGLSIELPAGVKYQSARGPSDHLAENGLLVFKSIGRLDPGKTAVYRVYLLGTTAGDHRLRVRVASDSVSEPLIGEELTKFQAE